jgi:hypothetical protein
LQACDDASAQARFIAVLRPGVLGGTGRDGRGRNALTFKWLIRGCRVSLVILSDVPHGQVVRRDLVYEVSAMTLCRP